MVPFSVYVLFRVWGLTVTQVSNPCPLLVNIVTVCLFVIAAAEVITVPSFQKTDYSYISFPTPVGLFLTSTITFSFIPYASEGLLLYSAYRLSATPADFISLAMKDGFLEFRYNLGSGINPINSSTRLTLGQWYEVYASRTGRTGT